MRGADVVRAGGDQPLIDPMDAQIAFHGDVFLRVEGDGVIGAGRDTGLAAGACFRVENHHAVRAPLDGFNRAGRHAGGVLAVLAEGHVEGVITAVRVQVGGFHLFYLDNLEADGDVVFLLAGDLAGLAAPAGRVVDPESVGFHDSSPPFFSG